MQSSGVVLSDEVLIMLQYNCKETLLNAMFFFKVDPLKIAQDF
jgi:hypothetical protein